MTLGEMGLRQAFRHIGQAQSSYSSIQHLGGCIVGELTLGTIPIIFVVVSDPVASGNRPAGVPEATGRPAGLDLRLPRRQDQGSCAMHPVVTVTGGSEDGRGLPRAGHPRIGLRAKIGQSRVAWATSAQLPVGGLTLREGLGSIK